MDGAREGLAGGSVVGVLDLFERGHGRERWGFTWNASSSPEPT